jgi:hypothetical protein
MQEFFMSNLLVEQTEKTKLKPANLSWLDNPSIQRLLDVIVSIIADEYIQVAKQNPDIFSNGGAK